MSALRVAVRVGVVACVAVACLLGAGRLDDALAVFDFQADTNVAATFNERTYPQIDGLDGGPRVMEDARLWMPEDASYRVVDGPSVPTEVTSGSLRIYLDVLLMPRRRTQLESVPWAFCYGCTRSTLGPEFEVLSDSGHGLLFARRRS
jgi:hypothetical protein